jgi:uncharacterized repeat protein (TIGR03943 family)
LPEQTSETTKDAGRRLVLRSTGTRWLGVGLASVLAVVTLSLIATGRIGLYINPESSWFAGGMSVLVLIGAALSFLLPLGAEDDHGHDHGDAAPEDEEHDEHEHEHDDGAATRVLVLTGGTIATAVVVGALVLPPASLSAELAMSRSTAGTPLFAGADVLALATSGDTSKFGIAEWSTAFATTTSPDTFAGDDVALVGFVTPDPDDADRFLLTRLVITHCVVDAQTASLPVTAPGWEGELAVGAWVSVDGTVVSDAAGLSIGDAALTAIDEPKDPYEY